MRGSQLEDELAAAWRPVLDPQLAVHRPGQVARREQPDPRPARRVVQADEGLEDALAPLDRDARSVVGDGQHDAAALAPAGDLDPTPDRGVFGGVLQEIFEQPTEQLRGADGDQRSLAERGTQPMPAQDRGQ